MINLSALTRVEYREVIEVPAAMTQDELDELVETRYQDVDGGEFWDDPEFWDKGECYWEKAGAEDRANGRLLKSGRIRKIPA